jgi:cellobiose-specific phosphotransferase system component IIC
MAGVMPETQKGDEMIKQHDTDWLDKAIAKNNRAVRMTRVLLYIATLCWLPFIIAYTKLFPIRWQEMKAKYEKETQ